VITTVIIAWHGTVTIQYDYRMARHSNNPIWLPHGTEQ